ncbi:MAG: hypothetical protein ABI867_29620 [Kofleriaceae bacterium]
MQLRLVLGPIKQPLASWQVHSDSVHGLAVLPKNKFVSSSEDGKLLLSSSETGKKLGTFSGHRGPVNSLCLTPDRKRLVTST